MAPCLANACVDLCKPHVDLDIDIDRPQAQHRLCWATCITALSGGLAGCSQRHTHAAGMYRRNHCLPDLRILSAYALLLSAGHRVGDESTRWAQFKPAAPGTAFAYQFVPKQVTHRVRHTQADRKPVKAHTTAGACLQRLETAVAGSCLTHNCPAIHLPLQAKSLIHIFDQAT